MNDNFIDSIAAFQKLGIENSRATRDAKEWEKSRVDCLSSVLKLMQMHPEQNVTVMGLTLEQIRTIKKAAEQYSVEKVVLFPYSDGQKVIPFVRVYGGDKEKFFGHLGWSTMRINSPTEGVSECDSLIKEYGITLYENI
jgi:hypothetical protein